jgi:hypothetical protein
MDSLIRQQVAHRRWFVVTTLLLFLWLTGCRDAAVTPTPATPAIASQAITVKVAQLLTDPVAYEGQLIAVTGQYSPVPLVICGVAPRVSPATWLLADGSGAIFAAGFENQLRPFLPIGLTMTVAGRWTRWQGMVGCGTEATNQEVWYLASREVVSPNPIAQVTLTPGGQLAAGLSAEPGQPITATLTPAAVSELPPQGSPQPLATANIQVTIVSLPGEPTASATVPAAGAATPTTTLAQPPLGTATITALPPTAGAATPTATTAPAGPTLTATVGDIIMPVTTATTTPSGAATATSNPAATPMVTPLPGTQGTITGAGGLDKGFLEPGDSHQYSFPITAGTTLTVMVSSSLGLDVALSILDENGEPIAEQNRVAGGETEVLQAVELPAAGTYGIVISDAASSGGYYTLMLLDSDSYIFVFQDTLAYGDEVTTLMLPDNDHFFHFEGTAGEHISLMVQPNDLSDLFFEIYGVDANLLVSLTSEGSAGEPEILSDFVLPATGFYSIRVGEMAFGLSAYTLTLETN